MGALHENLYGFTITSPLILGRKRKFQIKLVEQIKTHILGPETFSPENRAFYDIM